MERVLLQENIWQKVRECQFNKFRQYTDNRNCLVVITLLIFKHIFLQSPWCLRRMWSVETFR